MGKVDLRKLDSMVSRSRRAANACLTRMAVSAEGFVRNGMSRGARHSPSAPGTPPNIQRGFLVRAITHEPSVNLRSRVGVSRNVKYAAIHEYGGVVAAKGKYLTIPVNIQAKRAIERSGSVRNIRGLTLLRSKRGNLVLVPELGKSGRRVSGPVFVLKKSVTIPKRPYLRPAVEKNLPAIRDAGQREYARVMGVRL